QNLRHLQLREFQLRSLQPFHGVPPIVLAVGVAVAVGAGPSGGAPPVSPCSGGVPEVVPEKPPSRPGNPFSPSESWNEFTVIRRRSTETFAFVVLTRLSRPWMKSATWGKFPVKVRL